MGEDILTWSGLVLVSRNMKWVRIFSLGLDWSWCLGIGNG